MGGGGKGGTTTQTVKIPPEVLARYNAVNARAEEVASQPFQPYTGQFVAGLTPQQQAGMRGVDAAAGMAQPYFQTAAGMTTAGSQAVGPLTQQQIAYYQNPFTQSVVDPTLAALRQQQGQERAMQQAQAIRSGGFGGDRSGLERANLARQQTLGTAQAISPLMMQGYQTGVQTAMGQQGVRAQDLQRMMMAGQQMAGLGTGAQGAALQGAQAQIGAGTLEQQTQQADLTARYQQFLQERGFPYQQAQFLANIAMGTGALSGSTTTTTQPTSFFSDERMKENVHPIGETFDGQTIYKYNYKGEPGTQIGLIAQEVERKHPDAVGHVGGMKTVDYDRATEKAGGLGAAMASMGGAVHEPGAYARGGYAPGGLVDPNDIQAILASQRQSFGPFASGGPYGQSTEQAPFSGAGGIVPTNRLPTPKLMTAGPAPRQQEGGLRQAMSDIAQGGKFAEKAGNLLDKFQTPEAGVEGAETFGKKLAGFGKDVKDVFGLAHGGGVRPHYAAGGAGSINPYDPKQNAMDYFPEEVLEEGEEKRELMKPGQAPSGGGGGGLGSALGTAASVISAGKTVASALPAMFAFFSDRRLKHDVEPIGKTYDGQNIYRYHMGDGAMRMGLMAQEVAEHNPDAVARGPGGYLMLDYDKATEEAVPYEGGVRPRGGYQQGGSPEMSDEDYAIRTIASEMSGKSPEEARGIAAVIENRLRSGRFGSTYKDVVTAPNQFEPWSDPTRKNYPLRYAPGSAPYEMARAAFEQRGDDPTGGAMHFWAPAAQAELKRKPPSWDREGTMIGATKFVPGVDVGAGVRPSGGMPEAPRDAAPRAEGVRPSSGFFGGPPIEFASKTAQDPKGKPFESYKDFFTSRQFLIPFGAGLAGMASSPSRYLGSAILQGVGTGLGAYGAMEEQQAKVQEAVARKGLTEAQTGVQRAVENETDARAAGASIVDIQGVPHILVRDRRTGEERYVNFNIDYKRNRDAYDLVIKRGQQGGLGGAGPAVGAATAAPAVGGGRSDTIPAPGIKPIGVEARELPPPPGAEAAPPVAPAGGVMPPMPMASGPFALTDPVIERAQREAAERSNLPSKTIENLPDLLVDQSKIANVAESLKPTFVQIGVLGSTPRVGFTAQGPLQPLTTEIASLANDVVGRLRVFGGSRPFNQNDIADFEAWEKKLTELSSMAASAGDQTAVEALKRLRQMYPSAAQSPQGFAKNLAELLVVNQKDIQKAKFLSDYTDIVKQQDPRMPGRVDPAVGRLFEEQYGGVFEKHRDALEKMLRADNPAFLPRDERTKQLFLDDKGRPMSWFTYLQKYGDTLPPERVAQIERAFKAPGIMSYFRTGMGAQ